MNTDANESVCGSAPMAMASLFISLQPRVTSMAAPFIPKPMPSNAPEASLTMKQRQHIGAWTVRRREHIGRCDVDNEVKI